MTTAVAHPVHTWLTERTDDLRLLVERLARAETPSSDPASQAAAFAILAEELTSLGLDARAVRGAPVGDHLYARPSARRRELPLQILLGHMDTVWPHGTLADMPVAFDGERLSGPGVFDMKGGLAQMVFALRALQALGLEMPADPVVFVVTDEEIGSADSSRTLRRLARVAARVFVLEPSFGPEGKLKTARKGIGSYRLDVRGRASHAGLAPEAGVSAILELTHQVQRLFALNDHERGVTVNVGTIDGGLRPNVIAPHASAVVDVRVPTAEAAREVDEAIQRLAPVDPATTIEVRGGFGRPPLERTPRNRALFRQAQEFGAELGVEIDETEVGGGSDGNTTSLHTATLDGLGPVGDGAHALDEHLIVPRLVERTALLALLLAAPIATTEE